MVKGGTKAKAAGKQRFFVDIVNSLITKPPPKVPRKV
jgi:hypothetical protein